jgi:hypothetical protein
MATVVERTNLDGGRQTLLIGVVGLVLGGIAGGLVGISLQSEVPVLGSRESAPASSAPAIGPFTGTGSSTDIEAIRAQRYAPANAEFVDIEALRAQRYEAPLPVAPVTDIEAIRAQWYAPANAEFVDIEALRAQRYEAPGPAPVDIEALRAQRYAPAPVLDIEALRAQRYASGS